MVYEADIFDRSNMLEAEVSRLTRFRTIAVQHSVSITDPEPTLIRRR